MLRPTQPIKYPTGPGKTNNGLTILFTLWNHSRLVADQTWRLPVPFGGVALLEASTNLLNWEVLTPLTNNGAVFQWQQFGTARPRRFFRAVAGQ